MNKNIANLIGICLVFMIEFPAGASPDITNEEGKWFQKARIAYTQKDFDHAIKWAGRISAQSPDWLKSRLLLADIYAELDSLQAEIKCLETAASSASLPLIHFRLGECYYKSGSYDSGLIELEKFIATGSDGNLVVKANHLAECCKVSLELMKTPLAFQPQNLGDNINSRDDEYWPSLTVDGKTLVFTRLISMQGSSVHKQEDFYISRFDSSGWGTALPLAELNTPSNEGAQSISADGKLLFYTLCNHPDGMGSCDIFFSRYINGVWTKPRNAGEGINTPGWEGQPSFSSYGDILYFSSAREGGKGGRDLWQATLSGWRMDGLPVWSNIVNLGDSINSPGNEISPFIHPNGKDLYFSSDYRPGFGGYDLFHSSHSFDGKWSKAVNMGYPLNSKGNEQGFIIDRTGEIAYFSSNREPSGNMDIYSFALDRRIRPQPVSYIRGEIKNRITGLPVISAVHLSGGPYTQEVMTDDQGVFLIVLPLLDSLSLTVSKKGFLFYSEKIKLADSSSIQAPTNRNILLSPLYPGTFMDIYNIYFDTDSYTLLPASLPGLQDLLYLLLENPSLNLEIQGHTDNQGSSEHNLVLSEKRAQAVVQYLIEKGIAPSRISARGYGYVKPVDTNETESGRSRNRRTTILVL